MAVSARRRLIRTGFELIRRTLMKKKFVEKKKLSIFYPLLAVTGPQKWSKTLKNYLSDRYGQKEVDTNGFLIDTE